MRHKGFIYYKRLQSYEVHKPLDHISLVYWNVWSPLASVAPSLLDSHSFIACF